VSYEPKKGDKMTGFDEINHGDDVAITFRGKYVKTSNALTEKFGDGTADFTIRLTTDSAEAHVEILERAFKPAALYAVGDVIQTKPFVPFIKIFADTWAPIGGSNATRTDAGMTENEYIKHTTVLLTNIFEAEGAEK
jgi:hypothetical protein